MKNLLMQAFNSPVTCMTMSARLLIKLQQLIFIFGYAKEMILAHNFVNDNSN
jgi:hypothetical protein